MSEDAVWLDVLPSMDKFADKLGKGADEAAGKTGKKSGKAFGLAMLGGVAVVAGGTALAGKALYDLGSTFDSVSDGIRVGTGATGDALDALVGSAKNISTKVPLAIEDIGTAVADVNTRMGLTGPVLEEFTSKFLEAGRITGEALDINTISASFAAFKIEGADASTAMDTLYRVSQDTGVGINELAALTQKAGPAIQALGFNFEQTAAFVGGMDKAGLDASKMTAGLSKALVELAKDGEEPAEAFKRTTGEIQAMAEAGDIAGATELSSKLFGTKNAPQFMAALKDGRLNMDDLTAAAVGSGDTILEASADTADFAEQWQLFGNKMQILIAPLAEKVFNIIGAGMTWINDVAVPYLEKFFAGWSSGTGPLQDVSGVFTIIGAYIRDVLWPTLMTAGGYIRDALWPILQGLAGIVRDVVVPVLFDLWGIFSTKVLPILQAMAAFIVKNVIPVIMDFANRVVLPLMRLIGLAVKGMWDNLAKPALTLLFGFIKDYLGPAILWLWEKVVAPTFKFMGDAIDYFSRNWRDMWAGLQDAAAKPVNFIIGTVWNNGLRKALNLIPGVDLGEAKLVPLQGRASSAKGGGGGRKLSAMSGGGVLPGSSRYADGDDQLVMMRAGEGVTITEALDAYEHKRLLALNKAVLTGTSPARFRQQFQGLAGGGRVKPVVSGTRGNTYGGHTGLDFPAGHGAPVRATAAGTILRTPRLRTSYGNHIVQSIAGTALKALYAHLSSIGVRPGQSVTGGQVIGGVGNTGNSKGNHLHFEVGSALGRTSTVGSTRAWLGGAASIPGGSAGADEGGGFLDLLTTVPKMLVDLVKNVKDGLTTPWGLMMRDGIVGLVNGVKDWALDKINPFADNNTGKISKPAGKGAGDKFKPREYLNGTTNAAPGLAWLGENGLPELVEGPQLRYMQGGERVSSSATTRRLAGGGNGELRMVSGVLTLDDDGNAYIRGVAEDVYDDRADSAERWDRTRR